jgi:hypothetical protein
MIGEEVAGLRRRSAVSGLWLDILISVLLILPLTLTAYLPLSDLPNHLARQHVFGEWSSSSDLQTYYTYAFAIVPNLGLDIFVWIVRRATSIDFAVRLFCIVTQLLIFWGCRGISRQMGGGCIYRVTPFLSYGGPFQFGFLSFCFGIGLALVFFGLYLRERDSSPVRLVTIFVPLGFMLLLCHLAAFGLTAIVIGAFELSHRDSRFTGFSWHRLLYEVARRGIRAALFLLPPLLLFGTLSQTTDTAVYPMVWGTFHSKAEGLAALTLFSSPGAELALLGLATAGLLFALITDTVSVQRETVGILISTAIVFSLLPRTAFGGGYVDYRIPWAASFFIIATLIPGQRSSGYTVSLSFLFGGLVVTRLALIVVLWLNWDPIIAGIVSALRTLPTGARVIAVQGNPGSTSAAMSPSLIQVAAYAVAYRHAYWPGMFASFSGQILYFQPAYDHLWIEAPAELTQLDPIYNYVLLLRPRFVHLSATLPLRCIAHGNSFELYAVTTDDKTVPCAASSAAGAAGPAQQLFHAVPVAWRLAVRRDGGSVATSGTAQPSRLPAPLSRNSIHDQSADGLQHDGEDNAHGDAGATPQQLRTGG